MEGFKGMTAETAGPEPAERRMVYNLKNVRRTGRAVEGG